MAVFRDRGFKFEVGGLIILVCLRFKRGFGILEFEG